MGSILIRVDGSHSIGLGHIFRMRALADRLREIGMAPSFCTQKNTIGETLLRETGIPVFDLGEEEKDYVPAGVLKAADPDLVVFDILDTDETAYHSLKESTKAQTVAFDDTGAGLDHADAVINPIVFHWGRYNPEECKADLYEGPDYMILQDEILDKRNRHLAVKDRAEVITLAFGGTDDHAISERALAAVNAVSKPLTIRVNRGPGSLPSQDFAETTEESPHQVDIINTAESLIDLFSTSDLVICAGGIMLYELAALGVPSLAVAGEPHEIGNIEYWESHGTTHSLGRHEDLDIKLATSAIDALLNSKDRRQQMAANGQTVVDGKGLDRCQGIIETLVH